MDLSTLHVLLTLDFIGDVAFGTELHALRDGESCRILQIFRDVLPELMKCGLFPLRAAVPIMKSTRVMHQAIRELRAMGLEAVENARAKGESDKGTEFEGSKRIFEILAQCVQSGFIRILCIVLTALSRQIGPDGKYMFSADELVDNYGELQRSPRLVMCSSISSHVLSRWRRSHRTHHDFRCQ